MMKALNKALLALLFAALMLTPVALMEEVAPEAVDAPVEVSDSVELTDGDGGEMLEAQADYVAEGDASGIPIDAAHFPDPAFRKYVSNNIDWSRDSTLSEEERQGVMSISADNLGITSLQGIEYFPNIEHLGCSGNALTSLDVSKEAKLTNMDCQNNKLTSLNVSGCSALAILYCQNNSLTALNVSGCPALATLYCQNNSLTALNVSGCSALAILGCQDNSLTALNVSDCPLLVEIVDDAYTNPKGYSTQDGSRGLSFDGKVTLTAGSKVITSIPIDEAHFPDPAFRQYIADNFDQEKDGFLSKGECNVVAGLNLFKDTAEMINYDGAGMFRAGIGVNSIQGIEYFPNLNSFSSIGNDIASLDLSGRTKLTFLEFAGSSTITTINLSGCTSLTSIFCPGNKNLKTLNIDGCDNLTYLMCMGNPLLTIIDVRNCPGFAERIKNGKWRDGELRNIDPGTEVRCSKELSFLGIGNNTATPASFTNTSEGVTVTVDASSTAKNTVATVVAPAGSTTQLDLSGATGKKFKSSNKNVATVNKNGVVTFKGSGRVKITYKVGKKTRKVTLTVTDPTFPTGIALNLTGTVEAKVGEPVTLTATLNEGAVSGVKWKSSNKKIAAVNANGNVTFKKAGSVKITATSTRGNKKASVTFKVTK